MTMIPETGLKSECPQCFTVFIKKRSDQVYCSRQCKVKAMNKLYYEEVTKPKLELERIEYDKNKLLIRNALDRSIEDRKIEIKSRRDAVRSQGIEYDREKTTLENIDLAIFKAPYDRDRIEAAERLHKGHKLVDRTFKFTITLTECTDCKVKNPKMEPFLYRSLPRAIKSRLEKQRIYFWLKKKYGF